MGLCDADNAHSWDPGKRAQVPLHGLSCSRMIGRSSGTAQKSLNVVLCSAKPILQWRITVFFKKCISLWILFFFSLLAEHFLNTDLQEFFSPGSPGSLADPCCRALKPPAPAHSPPPSFSQTSFPPFSLFDCEEQEKIPITLLHCSVKRILKLLILLNHSFQCPCCHKTL